MASRLSLSLSSCFFQSLASRLLLLVGVVRVLDGDTLEVLHDNKAERIRLSGIDYPEKGQVYGLITITC